MAVPDQRAREPKIQAGGAAGTDLNNPEEKAKVNSRINQEPELLPAAADSHRTHADQPTRENTGGATLRRR